MRPRTKQCPSHGVRAPPQAVLQTKVVAEGDTEWLGLAHCREPERIGGGTEKRPYQWCGQTSPRSDTNPVAWSEGLGLADASKAEEQSADGAGAEGDHEKFRDTGPCLPQAPSIQVGAASLQPFGSRVPRPYRE